MAEQPRHEPRLLLPAALVRVWEEHGRAETLARKRQALRERPGVVWTRPNLCAVLPEAGDPAVFETALAVASELLTASEEGTAHGGLRLLVFPGQVEMPSGTVAANPVLEETERQAPTLEAGRIHLTTHAAARLEIRRKLRPAGAYQGPSGLRVPLLQALGEDAEAPPFRSPELLRRRLPYVRRPDLDRALASPAPLLVVTGAAGCGKTRALWEALAGAKVPPLWVRLRPARHAGPSLAAQLLLRTLAAGAATGTDFQGLGELGMDDEGLASALPGLLTQLGRRTGRPPAVVVDDLEALSPADLAGLERLAGAACSGGAAGSGGGFRLLAAGRSAPASLAAFSPAVLRVGPLPAAAAETTLTQLAAGLSLPATVRERLLETAQGNPFALEEGLAALLPLGLIRQVHGSFFFGASDAVPYHPSERLVQHAEAEACRLGAPWAARLLASAQAPLPPAILAAAGGEDPAAGWPGTWVAAGWAESVPTPWGEGLGITCPAFAAALRTTLPAEEESRLRAAVGTALPAAPRTAWRRYRLLAAATQRLPVLLEAIREGQTPPDALYEALAAELEEQRARTGGAPGAQPQRELLILWHLLPLAKKLGRLRDLAGELRLARGLAGGDTKKSLALAGLGAELEEQEGRLPEAEATLRQALTTIGGGDQRAGAVLALHLARLLIRQERQEEARELLERVLPHLASAHVSWLAASCLFLLGNVAVHQHRLRDGLELHQRALAVRRRLDPSKAVGASLSALGRIALLEGRYPDALAHYREAEGLLAAAGDKAEIGFALLGIGKALSRLGDYTAAAAPLRRALALREAGEDPAGAAIARLAVAENHLHLKHPDSALEEARRAHFDLCMLSALNTALGDAERLIATVLFLKRQWSEAGRAFPEAVAAHRRAKDPEAVMLDLAAWIELAIAAVDEEKVESLAAEITKLLGARLHFERREIGELRHYQALSWLAHRANRPRGALPHLRQAYRLLLAKADCLEPRERHSFFFQVREHQEIVNLATQEGLTWPEAVEGGEILPVSS